MNFKTHRFSDGQIVVISVPKYLSTDISEEFKDYLYSLVNQDNHKIIIDLSQTEYVDSSGMGAIVSRIGECRSKHGDIRLACPSEFMVSLLNITQLDKVIKTFPDTDSAIKSFSEV
jgi:anti-sigma B factor antagonist